MFRKDNKILWNKPGTKTQGFVKTGKAQKRARSLSRKKLLAPPSPIVLGFLKSKFYRRFWPELQIKGEK